MSKFNTRGHVTQPAVARATSVMRTVPSKQPNTRTYEGGAGWLKDPRTDLFIRSTSSFAGGEASFYEDGKVRDKILVDLVRQLAVEDWDWTANYLTWLRGPGNIRTAALILAAEAVDARLEAGFSAPVRSVMPTNREVISSVLKRADEPGEMLAYWLATHGRAIPKPIKRGVADAAVRLYHQHSLLKWDTASHGFRFGDVLDLVHPTPSPDKPWQGALFQYAIDRRHGRGTNVPEQLWVIRNNASFQARAKTDPTLLYSEQALSEAGLTWEDALSLAGQLGADKTKVWEAIIPSMGYMALIRNLRNFDESRVSNQLANRVIVKLVQEEEVRKSRQLPFRFLSAYKNAPSLRWAQALETALDLTLPNVPVLPGRTLILVDSSGSMQSKMSGKSSMSCLEAAALFGSVVALRNAGKADLFHFANYPAGVAVPRGGSILTLTNRIVSLCGQVGYGTEIELSLKRTYNKHDRVIIFSDGMTFGGAYAPARGAVGASVPQHVPVYLFNLRGYSASPMPTGDGARFDLGGLTDATFSLIPRLEAGLTGVWPWELDVTASV